jgi:hypothetical protein
MEENKIMENRLIGKMSEHNCPNCGKHLMQNPEGNEWCFSFDCTYHVRYGKKVTPREVAILNGRFAVDRV